MKRTLQIFRPGGKATRHQAQERRFYLGLLRLTFLIVLFSCFSISYSFAQTSQTYAWKNVAIGGGGFVSSIIPGKTEQGLMYARTDVGGAYRWDATNTRWVPLLDWVSENETGYLGVESLAIDHQSPNKVYMLVGISYFNGGKSAILRSDDYGNTFSIIDVSGQFRAHGNGMGRQTGEKLVVDPNKSNILFTGTRWNGLFKSTDYGSNWSRLNALDVTTTPNENGISFVVLDPSSSSQGTATQTMFVGVSRTGTNFYRSDDGGASFTAVAGAPTNFMPQRAALASDGNLYITYGNGAGPHGHWAVDEPMDAGQLWKYNTQTGSWTNVTPAGYTKAFAGISVDPNNLDRLVASTINTYLLQDNGAYGDRIFLSTNGGASWTDLFEGGMIMDTDGAFWVQNSSIHWTGSIEFDPFNTQKVWVTSGNGIFSTDNIGASPNVWKFQAHGVEETVPIELVSIPNGPTVSVILDYDGFRHTDLSQYAPVHSPRMGSIRGLAYAAQNPNVLLRAGGQLFYSTDMGITWTETSSRMGTQGSVAISADGNVFLHAPERSGTTYRTTNRGASWTTVNGLSISDAKPVADFENPNKFYAFNSGTGTMMVSKDGGASFSAAGSVGSGGSKIIRTVSGKEGHLWVALYGGGLARSTNSGQSFSKISTVSAAGAVGIGKAAVDSNYPTIFIWGTVNGVTGIHRSTDEGASWVRVNDDAHEYGGPGNGQFVVGDMNVFGRVYMSTAGRGIVYGEIEGGTDPEQPVNNKPVASLSATPTSGTAPLEVQFNGSQSSDPDGDALTYSWDFGDGSSGAGATVNHTYTTAGNYVATLTVVDGQGASDNASLTITVETSYGGGAGYVVREFWTGIGGTLVSDLTSHPSFPDDPSGSTQISSLESPSNFADNYGTRIRGYIHPAASGSFTFWIAGDDDSEFYISTDENPANAARVAYLNGWTAPKEWNKYPSQQSSSIALTAGNKYYFEVLHKEGAGGDNLAVAWQGPELVQQVVAGSFLSPYTGGSGTTDPKEPIAEKGTILREYWTGINGNYISSLTSHASYPASPAGSEQLSSLEGPTNWADNYGTRIRGYVYPPKSGSYTFWIAGDDNSELFISSDENPANAKRVAYVDGWTSVREWNKYASQKSVSVSLVAEKGYYVEVLHKEGFGGDNLAVAWKGPGISRQVIEGQYLSPFVPGSSANTIAKAYKHVESLEVESGNKVNIYPNPVENGFFIVSLGSGGVESATLQLFDLQGRLLFTTFVTDEQEVKIPEIKSGVYILQLNGPNGKLVKRLSVK